MKPKNTICLWFDKDAHEAARFYAVTFPDSKVTAVHEAPSDYPGGKKGDALTVEFTVLGIPCLGLNGGPVFRHSEAFSFQIATEKQEETDRYWNAIVGNGGTESQCGWCKDRWGLSWQITPRALTEELAAGGAEAKRAFEAMMGMKKIDVAAIEAARGGWRSRRLSDAACRVSPSPAALHRLINLATLIILLAAPLTRIAGRRLWRRRIVGLEEREEAVAATPPVARNGVTFRRNPRCRLARDEAALGLVVEHRNELGAVVGLGAQRLVRDDDRGAA